MITRPLLGLFGLGLAVANFARGEEVERNMWPVRVSELNASGQVQASESLGPLLFRKTFPDGSTSAGFRPFFIQNRDPHGAVTQAFFLYPLFFYNGDAEFYHWSVFELVRRSGQKAGAPAAAASGTDPAIFEVWPFYFSRVAPDDPDGNYHALFPVWGTLKHRLGMDNATWRFFPLYLRTRKNGIITANYIWPFVRITSGQSHGFTLWPLYGHIEGQRGAQQTFYLWPFIYRNTRPPEEDAPAGTPPSRQSGFLPFYARDERPGFIDETYGWPFFGYNDRTSPYRSHETRYFWPFFVQVRGADHYRNRWAPFYTHSVVKGTDKSWYAWPVFRRERWTDAGITQTRTQVLYFFYYSLDQKSATNPALPHADKLHIWPFLSQWDNGAGHRQIQVISPFEVFFPSNEKMRQTWTPLLALYRYDAMAGGVVRHSLLWNAVTLRREPGRSEFHLGPLLTVTREGGRKRVSILRGVLDWSRAAAGPARVTWLHFSRTSAAAFATR